LLSNLNTNYIQKVLLHYLDKQNQNNVLPQKPYTVEQ
jgi:hypothetical protein